MEFSFIAIHAGSEPVQRTVRHSTARYGTVPQVSFCTISYNFSTGTILSVVVPENCVRDVCTAYIVCVPFSTVCKIKISFFIFLKRFVSQNNRSTGTGTRTLESNRE